MGVLPASGMDGLAACHLWNGQVAACERNGQVSINAEATHRLPENGQVSINAEPTHRLPVEWTGGAPYPQLMQRSCSPEALRQALPVGLRHVQ
jgi:hypothetical protein